MNFQTLRKNYPRFYYRKYSYQISNNNLEIFFSFRIERENNKRPFEPDIYFRPEIRIENVNPEMIKRMGERTLNNLIFHLGLMEIPSYWKTTCSPEIIIEADHLSQEQINWWKDLILKGMGQFFYENKIDFKSKNFLTIRSNCQDSGFHASNLKNSDRFLVAVGGGKDSVVTLELFRQAEKEFNCFSLNPTELAREIIKLAGCKNPITVDRTIDLKLLALNKKGFLNGHTPFSAYLAFLSVLLAALFDYRHTIFSNERSSNEGNVKYLGKEINHQWSKSFEFEEMFRDYSKKYLIKDIEYFSFLRPLYEIQIAKLFSQFSKYFPIFLSCNEAYKTALGTKKQIKKWCCKCSKCLFVFLILYPFVEEKKLISIFGNNLFKNKKLIPIMKELIGDSKFKPFECVGTTKESLIALYLSWKKARDKGELPILLSYFEKNLKKQKDLEKQSELLLSSWDNQNNLPKEFEGILKNK